MQLRRANWRNVEEAGGAADKDGDKDAAAIGVPTNSVRVFDTACADDVGAAIHGYPSAVGVAGRLHDAAAKSQLQEVRRRPVQADASTAGVAGRRMSERAFNPGLLECETAAEDVDATTIRECAIAIAQRAARGRGEGDGAAADDGAVFDGDLA